VGTPNIDKQILVINRNICRHIAEANGETRGMVSQDILAQLRNFVEHIMLKIYARGNDIPDDYDNICKAIEYVEAQGKYKDIRRFHDFLQIVASHYTMDEENSERLMLKYYEYLLKLRKFLHDKYSLEILDNLEDFPIDLDKTLQEYYEKIAVKIKTYNGVRYGKSERYYMLKKKPFFVEGEIYYEITFTPANDYVNKSNRIIAFSEYDISDDYAVRLTCVEDNIEILGMTMPVLIVTNWSVSIRDCEFKNFISVVSGQYKDAGKSEKLNLLSFLTYTGFNLVELVCFSDQKYSAARSTILESARAFPFMDALDKSREIIKRDRPGANILRYILLHMNNVFIKDQRGGSSNNYLSNLYLQNGCIPFDKMPFISFPMRHTSRLSDIFKCIPVKNHQHELLARFVHNKTEIEGKLFTSLKELDGFENIPQLVDTYNDKLWSGHFESGKLVIEKGQIFINGYKNDTVNIISRLKAFTISGIQNYSNKMAVWLQDPNNGVDCDEKKEAMLHMFDQSCVALIYGSAGTGKSTLINHLSHYFAANSKLFLAQTNPAVDNLKRKVTAADSEYMTIAKFIKRSNIRTEYDVLVIDECSTVSNKDMWQVLQKAQFKILILVGDTYQISAIRFGNWFSVARAFIPETAVFELTKPYRTNDTGLLTLWERVRAMDDRILEAIIRKDYSVTLDASIFDAAEDDEIILCLNYDGLYGINNINRFLQESNPNEPIEWGIQRFKVGDPVLFNENERFGTGVYNNMKGKIRSIEIVDEDEPQERIVFDVELEKVIDGMDALGADFMFVDDEHPDAENSVIRFYVNKLKSTDEDDDNSACDVIPFQVAYAVSIHKAQGLEYSSVKIVITDEVDELITHNIFYTAITRAQKKLKIYWTPEVEKKVLSTIKPKDINKDINILKQYGL
jgi:energy-coupling factor transporter ATP-binding protein EcfA2